MSEVDEIKQKNAQNEAVKKTLALIKAQKGKH